AADCDVAGGGVGGVGIVTVTVGRVARGAGTVTDTGAVRGAAAGSDDGGGVARRWLRQARGPVGPHVARASAMPIQAGSSVVRGGGGGVGGVAVGLQGDGVHGGVAGPGVFGVVLDHGRGPGGVGAADVGVPDELEGEFGSGDVELVGSGGGGVGHPLADVAVEG